MASFTVKHTSDTVTTDLSTYNLWVQGHSVPFGGDPVIDTVNIPGKDGGFNYGNEPGPGELLIQCVVKSPTHATLITDLANILAAMPTATDLGIYIDGLDVFWTGLRASGIRGRVIEIAQTTIEFNLLFAIAEPTPTDIP